MTTFALPLEFGRRPCDRHMIRILPGDREFALWRMVLVWQDFATAREDRRNVPLDPERRAASDTVAILEEYVGWAGEAGAFVEAGIESGFFLLVPLADGEAELVLVDFFPANASASAVNRSVKGGVNRSYKNAALRAEVAAGDQLQLWNSAGGAPVSGASQSEMRDAAFLVHCICQCLRRQPPEDKQWRETILAKALDVVRSVSPAHRKAVLRWFINERDSQRIPGRLDFVLDQFPAFVPEAARDFLS